MTEAEEPGIEFEQAQAAKNQCGWVPDAPGSGAAAKGRRGV
jgi:hypothetical protein